jgi:hypothetical protein
LTYLSDLPSQWAGTSGLDGIATHGVSDEDFAAWCQKSLEALAKGSLFY